jgi:hypothetical protein
MLRDARDIAAAIAYGKELDRLRDDQLRRGLTGQPIPPEELRALEAGVVQKVRAEYFNLPARQMFMPIQDAAALNDDADFAKRQTLLMEEATLDSHRLLCEIPFVGQPGFDDPDPPALAPASLPIADPRPSKLPVHP